MTLSLPLPSLVLKLPSYSSFWPRTQSLLPLRHAWEAIVLCCHSLITLCHGKYRYEILRILFLISCIKTKVAKLYIYFRCEQRFYSFSKTVNLLGAEWILKWNHSSESYHAASTLLWCGAQWIKLCLGPLHAMIWNGSNDYQVVVISRLSRFIFSVDEIPIGSKVIFK